MLKLFLMSFLFTHSVFCENTPKEIEKKKEALNHPFVLYVFAGSDWCANCRRLEANVLSDSAFLFKLDSMQVRLEILDFPQRKKLSSEIVAYNQSMSEKLGFNGDFPSLMLYSTQKDKSNILLYKNENAAEFYQMVCHELMRLNE